jgi:hypothetical protein
MFEFPVKAPDGAVTRNDMTALQQLEVWERNRVHYTEHNVSATVHVDDHEWLDVGHWVWNHWEIMCGLSFFPKTNSAFALTPYEEITAEEYEKRIASFPEIDYSQLQRIEKDDMTNLAQDAACSAGKCDI